VLVTDDNRDCADTIAMILRSAGHEVLVFYEGKPALDAAEAFQPDAAVLDIGLPGLNGYDLARGLRERMGSTGLLLVAMTGWGQEEDVRNARAAGFDFHLVKPVEPHRLLEILAQVQRG
jgi:DNA-binding response OmpR family regulator